MLNRLSDFSASLWYWLGLVLLALAMEGAALYYQYGLDYGPCVHCIHVRIWLVGVIILGLLALWLRRWVWSNTLLHAGIGGLMYGMLGSSQELLWTEQGKIMGSCSFDLGLPAWLALDSWFPALFEVKESCGDTPELLFGISMAEALVPFAWAMIILSGLMVVLSLLRLRR
jgi:disulfide bond formation protein DsbB